MCNIEEIESSLGKASYGQIAAALASSSSSELLKLLDCASIPIGDTAASVLSTRGETQLLIDALVSQRIRTALGRVRAVNMLCRFGRRCPEALAAYVHCLDDRSDRVLDCALFGVVFMRASEEVPALRDRLALARPGSQRAVRIAQAISALESNSPFDYAPGFADPNGMWELPKR